MTIAKPILETDTNDEQFETEGNDEINNTDRESTNEKDSNPEIDANENEIVEVETGQTIKTEIPESDKDTFHETDTTSSINVDPIIETGKIGVKADQILEDSSPKFTAKALLIEGLIHEIQGSQLKDVKKEHSDKGSISDSEMVECPNSDENQSLEGSIHAMSELEKEDLVHESEDNSSASDSSSDVLEDGPIEHLHENG